MYFYTTNSSVIPPEGSTLCWFVGESVPERLGYKSPLRPRIGELMNFTGLGGEGTAMVHSIVQHSNPSRTWLEIKLG